jgi:subtilisin family serine protease
MRKVFNILIVLVLLLSLTPAAFAQDAGPEGLERSLPASVADMALDEPLTAQFDLQTGLDASLSGASGTTGVIVRLRADSVAERNIRGRSAQRIGRILDLTQDRLLERILALDPAAEVLGRTQIVLNALYLRVDGAVLDAIARDAAVQRVAPLGTYELDLSETVPYIGASAVQGMGYTGAGVRVAVLDSGVDYTHANLGGSGDPAEYAANDPTVIEAGTFPTAKIVGGYDFVGSDWPNAPEAPDPDPLDDGPEAGHGTHVADIIGGMDGVAPDADIYAVKVCSSVSTSCSGFALIMGMEFAADPDGDGDPADHVDLINMSLGSSYGQPFDDDLVLAVDNATMIGILTVASAGNSANKPYATGTPAGAQSALSVAQTSVPSAFQPFLTVNAPEAYAGDYVAVFQPWSVYPTAVISAPMQYGDGAGGNLLGCDPFTAGSLAGKIVLVDRGACNFTLKISNISQAGGLAGIIGLVAPGDPFEGGDGGDRPIDIPGYMVSQAVSNTFKAAIDTGESMMTIDPEYGLPLVGSMVGSSSRGPRNQDSMLKPEIGAPGASVSAIAGTGTETGPFGGTSGAAPMVTGSAALLLQAYPDLTPAEVKARLMNNSETDIVTDKLSNQPAPISRIGGGEVRVDRAVLAPAAAWDDESLLGSLSFGFMDVSKSTVNLFKTVRVRNYTDETIVYNVTPTFRMEDDMLNGAVEVQAPQQVTVKGGKDATFTVKLTIHGELLRGNYMNSGSQGANPAGLDLNEYDGYLILDDGSHPIHMPWHILPRKAAEVIARPDLKFNKEGVAMLNVVNRGVGTAQIDAYSLLAVSDNIPSGGLGQQMPVPDLRAVGVQTFPVPAGFCSADPSFLWAFAINTWERQSHLLPVSHWVYLDTNQDGTFDYAVINRDVSLTNLTDGRQLTWSVDLSTGAAEAFFFAEHATNTGNTILYICGEQIGLSGGDMLNTFVDVAVEATDFYFGGPGDFVDGITITPLGERYFGLFSDVEGKQKTFVDVYDFGPKYNQDLGLLLITNGDRGTGARGGATQETEAVIVFAR